MERLVIRRVNPQPQNSDCTGAGAGNWDAIRLITESCTQNTHNTNPTPAPRPPAVCALRTEMHPACLQNDSLPGFQHSASFFRHLHLVR